MASLATRSEQVAWRRQAWVTALMAIVVAIGFSVQLLMGRSSFDAPILVHAHAVVFFGWVALSAVQAGLAATGNLGWHRPLGWLGAAWVLVMVPIGFALMLTNIANGRLPFFFQPQVFLMQNLGTLICFGVLTAWAIQLRRNTGWHRRLHLCALATLMGPAFGRLLPMPLLIPWALEIAAIPGLLFPVWVAWREWQEDGAVHPAWVPGLLALPLTLSLAWLLAHSPLGDAIYATVVDGGPVAGRSGFGFGSPPPGM
jgi:hypothetical protein